MVYIKAIKYYLPESVVTNEELEADFPEWTVEKIADKSNNPTLRCGRHEAVANAIIFLPNDAAAWITRIEMPVCGGIDP